MQLNARELLQRSTEQLWLEISDGIYQIVFDDGEVIESKGREILYSSYFWDMIRRYPNTPILKRHHVKSIIKDGYLNKETHIRLLNSIYWDVAETYQMHTPHERDQLTEFVYQLTNNAYNDLTCRLEAYVVGLDLLDFLEVDQDPEINQALAVVEPSEESINQTYKVILNRLTKSEDFKNNPLAFATRSGMVNKNQVVQCVGPRGYVTEVDGYIMRVPILRGFFRGMRSVYNATAESHSAGKALFYAEAPLQDGEYFSRRLQLMTVAIEKIIWNAIGTNHNTSLSGEYDCGSKDYLSWRVKGPETHHGDIVYPGDLKFLSGKYYLDPETQELKSIGKNDQHLIGKTLKIRTVLGCNHKDKHSVCSVCFGRMAHNVSPYANIGHLAAATMTQQTTQSILSTKHLVASSSSETIYLPEQANKIFSINEKDAMFFIKPEWKDKPLQITVTADEAYGLNDLEIMGDLVNVNPLRVSAIEMIEVKYHEGKTPRQLLVNTNFHGCRAILTSEFLNYLKIHNWETDPNGNFIFTFQHWDFNKPIILVPQKEYSYSRHAAEISAVIESRLKDITDRNHPDSPKSTLMELFDLVNSKLNVNIVCLEIIIYSIMCADILNNKFGLARGSKTAGLGVRELVIYNRSLSAAFAYERLGQKVINKPSSFFMNDRDDSIFDVFFDPYNVVKEAKRLGKL